MVSDERASCSYAGRCNSSRCPAHGKASDERAAVKLLGPFHVPRADLEAELAAQGLTVVTTAERDELTRLREHIEKRAACHNCGPCPCTETD